MKKSYCGACKKTFVNGEEFCNICGNELKTKKLFTKKNIIILFIILFLVTASIITFCVIHSIANKDKIKFPGKLNPETKSMLTDKEERIVNSFVKDIVDSYNAGDESNNYYKYLVYEKHKDEFDEMLENYEYYAETTEEKKFKISLLAIPIVAICVEGVSITGLIEDEYASPEEIKLYIKDCINGLLNDLYY